MGTTVGTTGHVLYYHSETGLTIPLRLSGRSWRDDETPELCGEVFDMLVGAPHGVGFDVRQLTCDPVGRVAHFVEPRAARGARGMLAVLSAPALRVQGLAEGGNRHGIGAVIASRKHVGMTARDAVRRPQHRHGLLGQRGNVVPCAFSCARRVSARAPRRDRIPPTRPRPLRGGGKE